MSYRDQRGFTDTQDNQKDFSEKYIDNNAGPFLATVKYTVDPQRMGRLGVNIPALTHTTTPNARQITWCQYLSPFYGVTPLAGVNSQDPYGYNSSQTSYGMWAIPPDIDTSVLVIFAKGDAGKPTAFWMGCVQEPQTNQQIPGHGSTVNTAMPAGATDFTQDKVNAFGSDLLPAGEKNRRATDLPGTLEQQKFPINVRLADQLKAQGLIQDPVRGTTTSSARRESPSQVFGLSTPGRISPNSAEPRIGLNGAPVRVDRESGHSFVMDDGDANGDNQLTRIRTSSGHQILLHDTEGTVYIANGSGKAFIEMESDGTISVFSDAGINVRTKQDFNLHSDRNINFHAKGSLNFSSEQHVNLNAEGYVFTMGQKGILNSSQGGAVRTFGKDGISSFTNGTQLHGSRGLFHLAGLQVHFNSVPASSSWGPKWLKPDAVGIKVTNGLIDIDTSNPFRPADPNKTKVIGVDKFDNPIEQKEVGSQPRKVPNKTTVSDFVTHEPYDRKSSTQRKKELIAQMISDIKDENPDITAQELQDIKAQLLKQPSINAVSNQLTRIVNLNSNIKLNVNKLNDLKSQAKNIDSLIKSNIQSNVMNFVQGQIASAISTGVSAVRSFFRF